VVDAGGFLMLANARARTLFKLTTEDLARPFQDLELSYRPLELRFKIQQVYVERRPSQVDEVEWPTPSGEIAHLQVQVVPLIDDYQALLGASVNFTDVTRSRRYKEELEHANQGLEDAYTELQSTNEELETTYEEMQATNQELQTINDELGQRTAELNQLNAFLESIWAGLDGAVTVLDADLRVLVWNHGAEDLWGVRQEELQGQHFLNLDIGLPIEQVRPTLKAAMSGQDGTKSTMITATNRRGRTVSCRVSCSPLVDNDKNLRGMIVLVVDQSDREPPTLTG
jgi:two-component system CheB/CheR fusion protein